MEIGRLYSIAGGIYEVIHIAYSTGHVTFKSWNEDSLGEERIVSMVGNSVQRAVRLEGQELARVTERVQRQIEALEDRTNPLRAIRQRFTREV